MNIILYPRASPSDRLRIWVGAFQVTDPPVLSWLLNDDPTVPDALRQISSVRSDELLPIGIPPSSVSRAFTGVYEFRGLEPDTLYRVTLNTAGEARTLETKTLPESVPTQLDRSFNVLLISCFHQAEDRGGVAS